MINVSVRISSNITTMHCLILSTKIHRFLITSKTNKECIVIVTVKLSTVFYHYVCDNQYNRTEIIMTKAVYIVRGFAATVMLCSSAAAHITRWHGSARVF